MLLSKKPAVLFLAIAAEKPDIKSRTVICFDVRTCTVDELQSFLEDKLAKLDIVAAEDDAVEEDKPKEQDFADSNE